ncbi:MAG TPA: hypothetical protein DDY98_00050 [Ruminococcaceae bacterium]|nr:hypothetical protein [Oscillospiraceae bacterium]
MEYNRLTAKALKLMRMTATSEGVAFVGLSLIPILLCTQGVTEFILIAAAVLLALGWSVAMPLLRHRRYRYLITADRMEIIEGVFWVNRTVVPIACIYQINQTKGPLDNLFGLAEVTVITAGSRATIRFLEEKRASELTERLNEAAAQKRSGGNGDV